MARKTCSVVGCHSPVHGRGWCHRHYGKWSTHGDPLSCGDSNKYREVILRIAQREFTAMDLANETGITHHYACVRIYYWQRKGIIRRIGNLRPQKGKPNRYVLTEEGHRELAVLNGSRADQYDASHALAAALGYRQGGATLAR